MFSIRLFVITMLGLVTTILVSAQNPPAQTLLPACPKKNQCGYINRNGVMVIEAKYAFVQEFSDGMAGVGVLSGEDSIFGYIDESGREIVRPQYNWVRPFSEGMGLVRIDEDGNLNGFVDKTGKLVIAPREGWLFPFSDGLALFHCKVPAGTQSEPDKVEYLRGFIDKTGEVAIKCDIPDADPFSEGLAPACLKVGCGFIDTKGNWAIQPVFNETRRFSEGLAAVEVTGNNKSRIWGFVDKSGKIAIQPMYGSVQQFSEGLAAVSRVYPTYGFISRTGELVIPLKFTSPSNFSDGLAAVSVGDGSEYSKKYRYIDRDGKFISGKTYFFAGDFKSGIAEVGKVNFWTKLFKDSGLGRGLMSETSIYIDKDEKVIWKATSKF